MKTLSTQLLVVIATLTTSLFSQADSSCLIRATNDELISELSQRLNSPNNPQPIPNSPILSIICDSSYLRLTSIITNTNAKNSKSYYIGDLNKCNEITSSLDLVTNIELRRNLLLSICDSSYLKKIILNSNGTLTEIESIYIGNFESCMKTAISQNQRLRP